MSHTQEPWEDKKVIEHFWSKVDKTGDCWLWTRGTSGFGYGNFHFWKSNMRAHRFSYQLHNGKITEHECVCHSCDNPRCVNPNHLWIGTRAENNADKKAKGRAVNPIQLSGEGNSNVELTTPEVVAARVMVRCGMPQARVANFLGVSVATICMIVKGERRSDETERRVSACVNACAGIPNEDLIGGSDKGINWILTASYVAKQRDEITAELELAKIEIHRLNHQHKNDECANRMLLAEIEHINGEKK